MLAPLRGIDAASDRYIRALAAAQKKHPEVDNRPVLIHGQVLREDQVDAADKMGLFLSLFPMHTYYYNPWTLTQSQWNGKGSGI